jgi:hypothetical protein
MKKNIKIYMLLALLLPLRLSGQQETKNGLIGLLDQIVMAKRYWNNLSYSPVKRALTRPASHWAHETWKEEIPNKLEHLEATVAEMLGKTVGGINLEQERFEVFKKEVEKSLLQNGVPPHFSRYWLGYSCGAIAAGIAIYKVRQKLDDTCVFTFQSDDPVYDRVVSNLKTGDTKFNFHATCQATDRFIRTEKQYAPLVQTAIFKGSNGTMPAKRTTTLNDAVMEFYNQKGNNVFKEFLQTGVVDPLNNLYKKLFEKTNTKSFGDPQKAALNYKTGLKALEFTALKEGHYPSLFDPREIQEGKIILHRSLEELETLREGALKIEQEQGLVANGAYYLGRKITGRPSTFADAWASKFKEVETKFAHGFDAVNKIDQKLTLMIEFCAMMPTALLGWMGYKGASSLMARHYQKTVIDPLKQDLHDFEILLDEHRHGKTSDLAFQGMRVYWVSKLCAYKDKIVSEHRMNFNRDLERLASNISVYHQLSIITALLHYGIPNF